MFSLKKKTFSKSDATSSCFRLLDFLAFFWGSRRRNRAKTSLVSAALLNVACLAACIIALSCTNFELFAFSGASESDTS